MDKDYPKKRAIVSALLKTFEKKEAMKLAAQVMNSSLTKSLELAEDLGIMNLVMEDVRFEMIDQSDTVTELPVQIQQNVVLDHIEHKFEDEELMQEAITNISKKSMQELKRDNINIWFEQVENEETIKICSINNIVMSDHQLVMEVKRRILGLEFNPEIILKPLPWKERLHNNWFMPDIKKKSVEHNEFPILEGRPSGKYLQLTDKIPIRIEYIAKHHLNQTNSDDGEVRRMRLCYYYYQLWNFITYHPHMFESTYHLCLLRLARITSCSKSTRLISIQRDIIIMEEMREDIYKLFLIKSKSWLQKDILAKYYNNAAAYLRQVYIECQLLIIEYGDEARKLIPSCFYWISIKPIMPGKGRSNYTLKRKHIPPWIYTEYWIKVKAKTNLDIPIENIMEGDYDNEAMKIWTDNPYFMDPNNYSLSHERKVKHYIKSKYVGHLYERVIMFKEHVGSIQDLGKEYKRDTIRFNRSENLNFIN